MRKQRDRKGRQLPAVTQTGNSRIDREERKQSREHWPKARVWKDRQHTLTNEQTVQRGDFESLQRLAVGPSHSCRGQDVYNSRILAQKAHPASLRVLNGRKDRCSGSAEAGAE